MSPKNKGVIAAQKIYSEFGFESPLDFELEDLIHVRDIIFEEKIMSNADGRIVFGKFKTKITINSGIKNVGRKRFTLAHELGHFELHHNLNTHLNDNRLTIDWFKNGGQEYEANQFATELLMPQNIFLNFIKNKRFSPDLLRDISIFFQTSLTSAAFRYLEIGTHPLFLFYSKNSTLIYWKNSSNYYKKVKDITNLSVPEDSVAMEYYKEKIIYRKEESKQQITNSTWFINQYSDISQKVYEYAIITKDHNTVLSVVWEE